MGGLFQNPSKNTKSSGIQTARKWDVAEPERRKNRRTTRLQWARWSGSTDPGCVWRAEGDDDRIYKIYRLLRPTPSERGRRLYYELRLVRAGRMILGFRFGFVHNAKHSAQLQEDAALHQKFLRGSDVQATI